MSELITSANVTSFVRSLVGETTAKHWTDTEITLYIKFAMQIVMNKYWHLISPRDAKVVAASLVANTSYVEMPGASVGVASFTGSGLNDATYGGVYGHRANLTYEVVIDGASPDTFKWSKDGGTTFEATTVAITGSAQDLDNGVTVTFAATTGHTSADLWNSACVSTKASKVLRVERAETRELLRFIESNELWKFSLFDDGSASTDYLNVWYLEYKSTIGDFPEALRPLIAVEAVIFAFSKDKGINPGILNLQRKFEESAIAYLSTESMYEPAMFGEYPLERTYTYANPSAWSYRDGRIYLYKAYDEDV